MSSATLAKTVLLTLLALTAFAANSVLCRAALGDDTIDAASFSALRLISGVIVLLAILALRGARDGPTSRGSWRAGFMLFLYAVPFSYAYITLDTGTGALILFGAVQITMIVQSLLTGNRLHAAEWCGVVLAFAGLVYLNLPGVTAPSIVGFALMALAGVAWGFYTILGRQSAAPLMDTGFNFLRTLPFVVPLGLFAFSEIHITMVGCVLAILSGGIASGLGYTIWYTVLKNLTTTQAAVIQLSVPVIAALGGVLFVREAITLRLMVSAVLILGGILLVILGRRYFTMREARATVQ